MILNIRFSNIGSFSDKTTWNFANPKGSNDSAWETNTLGHKVNKVAAVLGANASGKTNLLRTIASAAKFITRTYEERGRRVGTGISPHIGVGGESEIEINFLLDGLEYKYYLLCNPGTVQKEKLSRKGSDSNKFKYIFERSLDDTGIKAKQQDFGFDKSKVEELPLGLSLIGAASSFNVPIAVKIANYFKCYTSQLDSFQEDFINIKNLINHSNFFYKNENYQATLNDFLHECDFDLKFVEFNQILQSTTDSTTDKRPSGDVILVGSHIIDEIEFKVPIFQESSGTQSALGLLRNILPVLENGGVAIVDEIDNDLHPHLLPHILDMFKHKHTNPKNAQLIFSCHTPEVFNVLDKYQIYLTEKINSKSEVLRLADIKGIRSDENMYAKYMAGAYGAVPNLL